MDSIFEIKSHIDLETGLYDEENPNYLLYSGFGQETASAVLKDYPIKNFIVKIIGWKNKYGDITYAKIRKTR
jgi:hypothetical protein